LRSLSTMRVMDFLENYGDKGFIVLKTILEISTDPSVDHRLGDFSYRLLVIKLQGRGIDYNPTNILRILEKEYGIIEKTYDSKRQKWWRITDPNAVREAIAQYTGGTEASDPRIRLLIIKYNSLEPGTLLAKLRRLASKGELTSIDKKVFREIVFNEMDMIVSIMEKMMEYEGVFQNEIKILNEILSLSELVASKISGRNKGMEKAEIGEAEEKDKYSPIRFSY
jgi:hypothetical protein